MGGDVLLFRATNGGVAGEDSFVAAGRIFTKIQFVGMEKWQVLALLGPPKSTTPRIPEFDDLDEPLRYFLYHDMNGFVYILHFRDGIVRDFEWHATE